MKRKYSYIGLGIIILIFGIIVIPKIIETLSEGTVVKENRTESVKNSDLAFVTRDGEKRKVPPFKFINQDGADKYDLLKTAIAHHRFTWIHPFGNGNGRVVRLLTYALMIKYGFNVKNGKIINPTAVIPLNCKNRLRDIILIIQFIFEYIFHVF